MISRVSENNDPEYGLARPSWRNNVSLLLVWQWRCLQDFFQESQEVSDVLVMTIMMGYMMNGGMPAGTEELKDMGVKNDDFTIDDI